MGNKLKYKILHSEDGIVLRDYLRRVVNLSGRLIKSAAREERIMVNGRVERLSYRLKENDVIEFDVEKEESQNVEPEKMDLEIVYEDSDLIVVNKSPNMVVHPTKSYPSGTLANGLVYYFREKGENCIVRLVSRLDMDTSGLILVAKNQFAHMALARDMQLESFEKNYLAVIHGNMHEEAGTIDLPIYRPLDVDSIKRVVDDRGQKSVTHYEVVDSFGDNDLVRLTLETGRTHQIRVHLSHLGHPIYGDTLYGDTDDSSLIGRQALHAYRLRIPHPRTGENLVLECNLPEDMNNLIRILKEK